MSVYAKDRQMKPSPNNSAQLLTPEILELYQAISADTRYGHFVRIPRRICCCLDYFKAGANGAAVIERLHAYYLFIGVVDELIDSTEVEAGNRVLRQLSHPTPSFDSETVRSRAGLVTEVLKSHIEARLYPQVLAKFEELYQAVIGERGAVTIKDFVEERKAVGRLTAELSYILISSLLDREREDLCAFLEDVGEVGCLIDTVIDLSSDRKQSLLKFAPSLKDRFIILVHALRAGMKISLSHPRLILLFLEAVGDNVLDGLRSIRPVETYPAFGSVIEKPAGGGTAKPLSAVAWTKS